MNVAYELEGVCTSIVAQDANGKLYHARNLVSDAGMYVGKYSASERAKKRGRQGRRTQTESRALVICIYARNTSPHSILIFFFLFFLFPFLL